jgi:hypothetical protein
MLVGTGISEADKDNLKQYNIKLIIYTLVRKN